MSLKIPGFVVEALPKAAAAGAAAGIVGPLCGSLMGQVGTVLLGATLAALLKECAEKFAKSAGEKLLESGLGSLRSEKAPSGDIEAASRKALQRALTEMPKLTRDAYPEWFARWEACLATEVPLRLDMPVSGELVPERLDALFQATLERLAAQGKEIQEKRVSVELSCDPLPSALWSELEEHLYVPLKRHFDELVHAPEYEEAWRQTEQRFQDVSAALLNSIKDDTKTIRRQQEIDSPKLDFLYQRALEKADAENRLPQEQLLRQQAESEREEWKQKFLELQKTIPSLNKTLETGDVATSVEDQIQRVEAAAASHMESRSTYASELYKLGQLYDLQFDWPRAYAAFRKAWELEKAYDYGSMYAFYAQRQLRHSEAIVVYEELLRQAGSLVERARLLNNLAAVYSDVQRMKEAESSYVEALTIRRRLAESNPDAFLPDVATTLNNLAILYSAVHWMKEAESSYVEALTIRRQLEASNPNAFLPDVAGTLNNLAILYRAVQRMKEAESAFVEALAIYRQLAASNPDAFLPDVAMTLNNLAILYRAVQRLKEAESSYVEALAIYRQLAASNPDAFLPDVAMTLTNLANLYRAVQRMKEAELAYVEALAIRRQLAASNPDAFLPDVAGTLNNLAVMYGDVQRMQEAESSYVEALTIRRQLAASNPDAYLPDVATTLNNLAVLYRTVQRMQEAESSYVEALTIRRQLEASNPNAFLPDVAMTLNNLAILYSAVQRMEEAESSYVEALAIYRQLAESNPDAFLPYVAGTLNNLANLYGDVQRMEEAESAYVEALAIYRQLAASNPDAFLPYVARTLNNLAYFQFTMGQYAPAATAIQEAEAILSPLWQANPPLHGNLQSSILWISILIEEAKGAPKAVLCDRARRAYEITYEERTRESLQRLIDRFCTGE